MIVDCECFWQIDCIFDEVLDFEGVECECFVEENCGFDMELCESVVCFLCVVDCLQIQLGGVLFGNFGDEFFLYFEDDEYYLGSQVGFYCLI